MIGFSEHEARRTVVSEMHLRRWPSLTAPVAIVQIVKVVAPSERDAETALFAALPEGSATDPASNPRHREGLLPGAVRFGWERHNEASTTTLFVPVPPYGEALDAFRSVEAMAAIDWAGTLPGKVIRATRLLVVADEQAAERVAPCLKFDPMELVTCHICGHEGQTGARLWSDFRLREDGFGMALIAANDLAPGDLSRTVQRLQELGNYRNLALLGLPVAQAGWKVLDGIEAHLASMTTRIADLAITDDDLLEDATRLLSDLLAQATASDYRMSATEAYATIVEDRLAELGIRPIAGFPSLADFTQRRLLPAMRTCNAHRRRGEQLAARAGQFISLFRTRIETRIENQNGKLLASMERNAVRQFQLQQLVEGLSVVALSYYGVSLVAHMLEGAEVVVPAIHAAVITAILTPVTAFVIWQYLHRAKRRLHG